MAIKQVSVNLGNLPGAISRLSTLLYREDLPYQALHISSHPEGIKAHLVSRSTDRLISFFTSYNFSFTEEPVIAALIPAHPGGLHAILRLLDRADLIIHRLYPARIGEGTAEAVIIETDNPALAETVLKESWIEIIS